VDGYNYILNILEKLGTIMSFKVPLMRPYFDSDELEEIKKVLESGWVAQGPKCEELEERLTEYLDIEHGMTVSSCTAALHLSLISLGIKEDDEVLVGDYTFPATGHAVLYCGAKPVFVDIDPLTYNIDPALIEDKINDRTKAIIPVHTFGQPADMDGIMEIAKKHDLYVIEDAACALGAKYKNRFAGTIGDIGCYSFHARKGITTGEGGFIVTNDKEKAERMRRLTVFGMSSAWDRERSGFCVPTFDELGYNYKMSDILAAVGVAQLKKLDKIIEKKRQLARYWDKVLMKIDTITQPHVSTDVEHVYQSYVALVDKGGDRNLLIEELASKGFQAQIGTYASHLQPVYKTDHLCPISKEIFYRAIALPLYYNLNESQIDNIEDSIETILENSS